MHETSPLADRVSIPARRRWVHLPKRKLRRVLFVAAYALFCGALAAGVARFYWSLRGDPQSVWDLYYPELNAAGLPQAHLARDDGSFDVLLLGGSVLEPTWGEVEAVLREKLDAACAGRNRLFNLGKSAHTSRDSLIKYAHLTGKAFDLVVVYDGINDVRMNNCPSDVFRDDYTHCAWYDGFEKRLAAGRISLPDAVSQQVETWKEQIGLGAPADTDAASPREIKTAGPLRENLGEIVRIAQSRGDRVLLSTYAYYLPENYTREGFDDRELDYSYRDDGRSCGAEMWGRPDFVRAALDAQNAAIRELAESLGDAALFVDQEALLEKEGKNFVDLCHPTHRGSRRFVENLWPAIAQEMVAWQSRQ